MVAGAAQGAQRGDDDRHFVQTGRRFVEPAGEPAEGEATAALAVVEGDESGEFECLAEVKVADLARLELGDEEVAALERSAECCAWAALRSHASEFSGPDG
jgi:hypothetical protein